MSGRPLTLPLSPADRGEGKQLQHLALGGPTERSDTDLIEVVQVFVGIRQWGRVRGLLTPRKGIAYSRTRAASSLKTALPA